ncbi:MAG: copper chaperone PCu(A)C, partial [Xanthomonadales bacterium]|nr:copper chaperone PCu(A)C [Xanthomonadales bacterium]
GMTAAYGELHNKSNETVRLEAYDSDAFANVSLHRSVIVDGVSRMRAQSNVEIAPGESLVLEPGGLHLMLMRSTRALSPGDEIEIGISSSGVRYTFNLLVETR